MTDRVPRSVVKRYSKHFPRQMVIRTVVEWRSDRSKTQSLLGGGGAAAAPRCANQLYFVPGFITYTECKRDEMV